MSKLSTFLHPVAVQEEKEVVVSRRFQDEDGKPVPFRIRALTQEENEEYARINADIHTYAEENITKFVTGEQDMSEFDAFVENLKSMNLNQVTAIKQAALDRYYGA